MDLMLNIVLYGFIGFFVFLSCALIIGMVGAVIYGFYMMIIIVLDEIKCRRKLK